LFLRRVLGRASFAVVVDSAWMTASASLMLRFVELIHWPCRQMISVQNFVRSSAKTRPKPPDLHLVDVDSEQRNQLVVVRICQSSKLLPLRTK
jgi:hypothetical protein